MRFAFVFSMMVFMALSVTATQAWGQQELRRELDRVYSDWRASLETKSLGNWQRATAAHRQMSIRNLIVSQQQAFPSAMFAVPMKPPETALLRFVDVKVNGPTASLIYFGKVDLGVADPSEIPDNLLYLNFVKEESGWKFDTTRLVNLEAMPDVRAALKTGGNSAALDNPELLPTGVVPPVAKPCPMPDRIGVLQVESFGYQTDANVNGFDVASVTDNAEEHIIIGGLRDGVNPLKLQIKQVPLPPEAPKDAERILRISAIILTGEQQRPVIEVFDWTPQAAVADGPQDLVIHVSRITMRQR